MKNHLIYILLFFIAFACGNADKKKLETLQEDVMSIHDDLMPKMGEIMNLKDELATNLKKIDSTSAAYPKLMQETDSLNYLLTESDNGMMDWMDEYNPDTLKALNIEDGEKYLIDQKNKILGIKESTNANIGIVKKYLKK